MSRLRRQVQTEPIDENWLPRIVDAWNAWGEPGFKLDRRLLEQLTVSHPAWHGHPSQALSHNGRLVAFCLAKRWGELTVIDAIMVCPEARRQGLGRRLVDGLGQGAVRFGGGPAHFLPGLPKDSKHLPFFTRLGFRRESEVEDLHMVLNERRGPFQNCRPEHRTSLLEMVEREFSPRWTDDTRRRIESGDIEDIVVLLHEETVIAFCHTWHSGSRMLGPSVFWLRHQSRGNWGGLGPLGVASRRQGQGLGRVLVEQALNSIAARGVTEVVVDWTTIGGFYQLFGFESWRSYHPLLRPPVTP